VLVPVSAFNLWFGSNFGIVTTEFQPMKIASTEAQWNTCQPCAFSLFQIGGFTESDQTPSFSIQIPRLLSFLATGTFSGEVQGINDMQQQYRRQYGRGDYIPSVRAAYWAMRVMAYFGTLIFMVAALGAFLYWRGRLVRTRWFLWTAVAAVPLPFLAALAGWVLTEMGRQPWIVQGLLRTSEANSPNVSETMLVASLAVLGALYAAFLVLDVWLMRRYARADSELGVPSEDAAQPALGF
jgi:cytochrome d ubiquinol oxidase subunit I